MLDCSQSGGVELGADRNVVRHAVTLLAVDNLTNHDQPRRVFSIRTSCPGRLCIMLRLEAANPVADGYLCGIHHVIGRGVKRH